LALSSETVLMAYSGGAIKVIYVNKRDGAMRKS
jgi:hypothetical protein